LQYAKEWSNQPGILDVLSQKRFIFWNQLMHLSGDMARMSAPQTNVNAAGETLLSARLPPHRPLRLLRLLPQSPQQRGGGGALCERQNKCSVFHGTTQMQRMHFANTAQTLFCSRTASTGFTNLMFYGDAGIL
jgi:hypothetical protein